jgi:hypothetical protein
MIFQTVSPTQIAVLAGNSDLEASVPTLLGFIERNPQNLAEVSFVGVNYSVRYDLMDCISREMRNFAAEPDRWPRTRLVRDGGMTHSFSATLPSPDCALRLTPARAPSLMDAQRT